MRHTEKYLPFILSGVLPGLNMVSAGSHDQTNPDIIISRYLVISTFLLLVWFANQYLLNRRRYFGSLFVQYLVIISANTLMISAMLLIDYLIIPEKLGAVAPYSVLFLRLSMGCVMYILILQSLKNLRERKSLMYQNLELQTETLKSQLETIKQQINPHFLFNSLNTLIDLIEDDQEQAVEFVRHFSHIYRFVLQSSKHDLVQLRDEVAFAEAYWHLLKMRFKEGVALDMQIPESVQKRLIPPLSMQLLLENAIKHNKVSAQEPLMIKVYFKNDQLLIENNVTPKPYVPPGEGIGLDNLQQRFELFTGKRIRFGLEGQLYRVVLPIEEH